MVWMIVTNQNLGVANLANMFLNMFNAGTGKRHVVLAAAGNMQRVERGRTSRGCPFPLPKRRDQILSLVVFAKEHPNYRECCVAAITASKLNECVVG